MGAGEVNSPGDDQDPEPDSRRGAVIGLILVLVLVVAGYFLVEALRTESNVEDCLMAARRNCAPLDVPMKR